MRTTIWLWGVAAGAGAATAALIACGGSLSGDGTAKSDSGAAGSDGSAESAAHPDAAAAADAGTTGDATTGDAVGTQDALPDGSSLDSGVCPPAPPATGTACSAPGTLCEYGKAWLAECDVVAACRQGSGAGPTWTLEYDGGSGCYVTSGGSACPASLAAAQGKACAPAGIACDYPEGWCECEISCGGPPPPPDAGTTWLCSSPPAAGCPSSRPRFGSSCANEPAGGCDYGLCCGGSNMQCLAGTWQGQILLGGCP